MWNHIARRNNASPGFNSACWDQLLTNCGYGNFRAPQLKLVGIGGWEARDVQIPNSSTPAQLEQCSVHIMRGPAPQLDLQPRDTFGPWLARRHIFDIQRHVFFLFFFIF
jgi:hypothetical protein